MITFKDAEILDHDEVFLAPHSVASWFNAILNRESIDHKYKNRLIVNKKYPEKIENTVKKFDELGARDTHCIEALVLPINPDYMFEKAKTCFGEDTDPDYEDYIHSFGGFTSKDAMHMHKNKDKTKTILQAVSDHNIPIPDTAIPDTKTPAQMLDELYTQA